MSPIALLALVAAIALLGYLLHALLAPEDY